MISQHSFYKSIHTRRFQKIWDAIMCCIIPSALFWLCANLVWYLGGVIGAGYQPTGYQIDGFHRLLTIENNYAIQYWMLPFYAIGNIFWVAGPIFIYFYKGKQTFYKFITISFVVFLVVFIMYCVLPVSREQYISQTYSEASAATGSLAETLTKYTNNIIHNDRYAYSSLPSMRMICTILIAFALFDGLFSGGVYREWRRWKWWQYLISSIFSVYTIFLCLSTFLLKLNFFVDVWVSLAICIIAWVVYSTISYRAVRNNPLAEYKPNLIEKFFTSVDVACYNYPADRMSYQWSVNAQNFLRFNLKTKKAQILFDVGISIAHILVYAALFAGSLAIILQEML